MLWTTSLAVSKTLQHILPAVLWLVPGLMSCTVHQEYRP